MTKYIAKKADANGYIDYNETENKTWHTLITRQMEVVKNRACDEFIHGLNLLNLPTDHVPQCKEVNDVLGDITGWSLTPVPAMIPEKEFYTLLANKNFPAASFIRIPEEIDYLKEPDIFHEIFGHCPLLTNHAYADFVEWYGKTALQCSRKEFKILTRLFWFTIEFGLFKRDDHFQVYGGGILSSPKETVYAVESDIPTRKPLNFLDALRTPYRYDEIQKLYFYIDNLDYLYQLQALDLHDLLRQTTELGDLPPSYKPC